MSLRSNPLFQFSQNRLGVDDLLSTAQNDVQNPAQGVAPGLVGVDTFQAASIEIVHFSASPANPASRPSSVEGVAGVFQPFELNNAIRDAWPVSSDIHTGAIRVDPINLTAMEHTVPVPETGSAPTLPPHSDSVDTHPSMLLEVLSPAPVAPVETSVMTTGNHYYPMSGGDFWCSEDGLFYDPKEGQIYSGKDAMFYSPEGMVCSPEVHPGGARSCEDLRLNIETHPSMPLEVEVLSPAPVAPVEASVDAMFHSPEGMVFSPEVHPGGVRDCEAIYLYPSVNDVLYNDNSGNMAMASSVLP